MKPATFFTLFVALCLVACGGTSVGRPCAADAECDHGQSCVTSIPNGFCTKPCFAEGSTQECPAGTICANHSGALRCSPTCQTQGDCRQELECNGVSGSETKACRPKAQ
ncbi:MAG: hypothetical protein ACOZIN_17145 [Myxococcota bacterium]